MVHAFEPPTHEEPIRTTVKPLCYYRLTYANSIVRINGVLTSVRTPSAAQIAAAGVEGVDYFRGGGQYVVDDATYAELQAGGFA